MPMVRLDLAYDGSGFRGYARQEGRRTVQGELERALAVLLGEIPESVVAGRTDAGVHARGQVVSFNTRSTPDLPAMMRSLNGLLGPEISVMEGALVEDGFHARHSAKWRRYRYRIGTGPAGDPLTRLFTWEVGRPLDFEAMSAVASSLVGEHDFASFCRAVEGSSSVRRVDESALTQQGAVIEFWIRANAFCHQMVRSLVGHMYDVGRGFAPADGIGEVLAAGDRSRVATVAPGHGLTLWEVGY
ncbi:MAG: tRNA pseudouridine(38-40) synthase TruA [Acidimicrobiia bacterium]